MKVIEALLDWALSIPVLDRLLMYLAEARSIKDCAASSWRCPRCKGWLSIRYVEGIPYARCRRCRLLGGFYALAEVNLSEEAKP